MIFKKKYTEEELVAACIINDRSAQKALYELYFPVVWAMCIKNIKNESDAMDIVNTGFLKVYKNLERYESRGNLEGWIRRIVYNSLVDHVRKNQKHTRYLVFDDIDLPHSDQSDVGLLEEDLMAQVNKLPQTQKQVFTMFAIEGYSHKEISEQLNFNESTSRWHLSEARKFLKELINKDQEGNYYVRQ